MANSLGRVRVLYSGFTGGPGLGQFYFQGATPGAFDTADATAAVAAVRAFLDSVKATFPAGWTGQVQSTVDVVDWVTGALQGVVPATGVALVTATGSGTTNATAGQLVQWFSSTVVNRRLLRGRTYLTPSAFSALSTSGVVNPTQLAAAQAGANALIATAAVTFSLWHRPNPFLTGNNGTCATVVSAGVPSKVCVLRSRRD